MFIPQNAVFSRFQLIPNMKPHDFGISALRIFSAAWKPWSASSPFPAPSGPPWLQTLASWFWTDKVIGSPESNKMMWICLIGFQQNSWHVFTNYYYSTSSWFSVLRPQAEWIFRSVRQRSRGDLHFVAVNLANSKALNLVPFLQWHLLGTWSIAPPNHPMMPWPSMAYKTQFLHLNGHNFGHIHKFCPYHSYIMFFHLQYIYIFHDIVHPHHIPTFHAGSSTPVVPQQQRLVHIQILIQLIGEAKGIAPWPDVEEDTVPRPASMEASSENLSGRMGKPRKHKIGGVLGVLILDVPLSPMTKIHILPYWKRC